MAAAAAAADWCCPSSFFGVSLELVIVECARGELTAGFWSIDCAWCESVNLSVNVWKLVWK